MPRNGTNTKSRILNAARTLYSTHGCDSTTLDDIITASGITKGAFYHYFKSKESLCETLLDEVIADYQHLAESIDPALEPIDRLRGMIGKLTELNTSGEWVNCRLILRLSADSHESHPKIQQKIRDFWLWYTAFFEELIQDSRNTGQLTTTLDTETQARLLMSLMAGTITLERIAPRKPASIDLAEIIIDALQP